MKKNHFLRYFFLLFAALLGSNSASATWYFYTICNVESSDSSQGLVYVTDNSKNNPSDTDYAESMSIRKDDSKTNGSNTSPGNCEFTFYLKALPLDGYKFDRWERMSGNTVAETIGEAEFQWDGKHSTASQSRDNPTGVSYTWKAYFVPANDVSKETNIRAGSITLDPIAPLVGQRVKATTSVDPIHDVNGNPLHSMNKNVMVLFDHWEKWVGEEKKEDLGTEETIEFDVDEPMTLKAIFKDLSEIPRIGKYYRVRNAWNRVLTVEGNYTLKVSGVTEVDNTLLRWALPTDHDYNNFHTGANNDEWAASDINPICPEAHPGTIFYIETGNLDDLNNPSTLSNTILSSQGVNTSTLTDGETFNVVKMSDSFCGYLGVNTIKTGQTVGFKTGNTTDKGAFVHIAGFGIGYLDCALAIQPIDEEHIDYFWFGADAEETMEFEGGYWTSMYTAFPYKVYDSGVEAYYAKETTTSGGQTYILLEKIDDGIVPANCGVLLKCAEYNSTKTNRLLPLNPADVDKTELEGNILTGVFQLYSDKNKNGRTTFDESSMRVLGKANGEIGFYKLKAAEDGGPAELKANRAYLDMSKLPAEAKAISFKLKSGESSGIEAIVEDGSSVMYEDNTVYDLSGRPVSHPAAGNIYLINGHKVLWK